MLLVGSFEVAFWMLALGFFVCIHLVGYVLFDLLVEHGWVC